LQKNYPKEVFQRKPKTSKNKLPLQIKINTTRNCYKKINETQSEQKLKYIIMENIEMAGPYIYE